MKRIITTAIALFLFGYTQAQSFVSTTPSNKNVLLETIGGINCFYCAEADYTALQLSAQHNNRIVWINEHAGLFAQPSSSEPDFRSAYANDFLSLIDLSTYPAAMLNRRYFSSLSQSNGVLAISPNDWSVAVDSILAESSPVNVAAIAELNISTRQLKVVVETYYTANALSSNHRLFVAFLQDSLLAPQEGGSTFNSGAINSDGKYTQRYIFQDFISNGTTISQTTAGSFRADTFYYNLPIDFNGWSTDFPNAKVAVWVAETDSSMVLNAAYAQKTMTATTSLSVEIESTDWAAEFDQLCGDESEIALYFKNTGTTPIDSVRVDYDVNGGAGTGSYTHRFSPALPCGYSTSFITPAISGLTNSINTVQLSMGLINGVTNPNIVPISTNINHASLYVSDSTNGVFTIRFDSYPTDIAWELRNETNGSVVVSGSNYATGNTTVTQTFGATNGHCYLLKVTDANGDGLCCSFGLGYYRLTIGSLQIIREDEFSFESGLRFTWQEGVIAVNQQEKQQFETAIFPNPASTHATLRIQSEEIADAELLVLNALGQSVGINQQLTINAGEQYVELPIENLAPGMYFISLRKGEELSITKLLIAR